jgi:hypothetical protein
VPRRRSASAPAPYTAILVVDGAHYLIIDRKRGGFRAVRLASNEAKLAQRTLDDAHADIEARLVGARQH